MTTPARAALKAFVDIVRGVPTSGEDGAPEASIVMPDAVRLQLIAAIDEILQETPAATDPVCSTCVTPSSCRTRRQCTLGLVRFAPAPLGGDPATLAHRYYQLVSRCVGPRQTTIPWEKLPAQHRQVFVEAFNLLLRGVTP